MPRPKQDLIPYTVVGYYDDDDQPFVEWTMGHDPVDAAQKAVLDAFDTPDEAKGSDLLIVEVLEGHVRGVLENKATLGAFEVLSADRLGGRWGEPPEQPPQICNRCGFHNDVHEDGSCPTEEQAIDRMNNV